MPRFDGKSEFLKVARCRLHDAKTLLAASGEAAKVVDRNTQGAKYLAGYAIECVLKVYIIDSQGCQTLGEAVSALRNRERLKAEERRRDIPDLSSAAGHKLIKLLELTDLEKYVASPFAIRKDWNICYRWDTSWRYDPAIPSMADASEFVLAVETVYNWIKSKL